MVGVDTQIQGKYHLFTLVNYINLQSTIAQTQWAVNDSS